MMLNRVSEIANPRAGRATQKVVIVNGSQEMMELLETVLDAGHYDVVFVTEVEHAYSQIKRNRPNLVLLCLGIDDPFGFQVLSMLKLDEDTEHIPVLTYTNEFDGGRSDDEPDEDDEPEAVLPLMRPELPMN
ncbi:MAG TPA: response regulator [Vicinamibacterales bacterium]|jgi:PleD family two-component response regulator